MKRLVTLILLSWLLAPAYASELPDLGESARATMSEAQEAQIGAEAMRQIRGDKDFLDDPETTDYINRLGRQLVAASPAPYRHFEFFVVRDASINAFALPGGYIGVHTGLISAVRNESELAGVLAHEISHVTQNHIARIVAAQKGSTLTTLAALAVAILAARSDNAQIAQAAVTTAQAMSIQNQLDYTREHEREADRIGLQTLSDSGYDPAGMASFFERLQANGRLYESKAPAYLRTHPLTYERMADLQNRLSELPYRQHLDSLDFQLVRARVQAAAGEPDDAYKHFKVLAASKQSDAATRYGFVLAALRVGERDTAVKAFNQVQPELTSPMAVTLAARLRQETGQPAKAVDILKAGLAKYPNYRPLVYDYARALLRVGRAADTKSYVAEKLRAWDDDDVLYRLLAESDHALGKRSEGHLAQAEAHIRLDQPAQAMEQLQLARQAGDGDFYTMSMVDARLRELRERQQREAKP
ncbi:M48 family peptidase [Parasulfuritortus cantonensis]|uniref:M48 family peptidase n=1 Tax=Parasulfuritortus cantonensis TaxID=2528202 RepID=A0A4R1BF10_9PROT|nr:M48 family metalloprotease [Parasulfuritortus cantonensis]TCJ15766.1 M48 family peptidase [Parasulfuritortus cantonensis]